GDELAELEEIMQRGEASPDTRTFELWDARFHSAIAAASRNELLSALLSIVQATRASQTWETIKVGNVTRQAREQYTQEHKEIFRALRERDASEAEARM